MTIKHLGGIFGRNPTFNDVTIDGGIYIGGDTSSNLLDDYEEGTFTPTISQGVTGITYAAQSGSYTKIGNLVFFRLQISISAGTAAASRFEIGGLPFSASVSSSAMYAYDNGTTVGSTTTNMPLWFISGTGIQAHTTAGASFLGTNLSAVGSLNFYLSGTYIA